MLLCALLNVILLTSAASTERNEIDRKPYIVFPVPFDLPNRNDRATQCWLRIEDEELIETVAVYCHIAMEFVRTYIHEYNTRKMTEDKVDVSLWNEEPQSLGDVLKVPDSGRKDIKHWKAATVLDPTTRMRLYVTRHAVCEVIMYSREGVTNYRVECDKILYFVNNHTSSGATIHLELSIQLAIIMICLTFAVLVT